VKYVDECFRSGLGELGILRFAPLCPPRPCQEEEERPQEYAKSAKDFFARLVLFCGKVFFRLTSDFFTSARRRPTMRA
jgi:hypothetical protein